MTKSEILDDVNKIFIEILDNDSITLNEGTTADQVENWDSITNIQLMVAIEKHFKIRFTSTEIQRFANIGNMCEAINTKLER